MKQILRSYLNNRDGVAATEFALIVPTLLILMIGVADFGFYINTTMKLESTSRAAAEYILKGGDEDSVQTDVINQTNMGFGSEELAAMQLSTEFVCECRDGEEVECTGGTCDAGDYRRRFVNVAITMPYETLFPYPGLPEDVNLAGRVRLQME